MSNLPILCIIRTALYSALLDKCSIIRLHCTVQVMSLRQSQTLVATHRPRLTGRSLSNLQCAEAAALLSMQWPRRRGRGLLLMQWPRRTGRGAPLNAVAAAHRPRRSLSMHWPRRSQWHTFISTCTCNVQWGTLLVSYACRIVICGLSDVQW